MLTRTYRRHRPDSSRPAILVERNTLIKSPAIGCRSRQFCTWARAYPGPCPYCRAEEQEKLESEQQATRRLRPRRLADRGDHEHRGAERHRHAEYTPRTATTSGDRNEKDQINAQPHDGHALTA
jgi:hypothetical protein